MSKYTQAGEQKNLYSVPSFLRSW